MRSGLPTLPLRRQLDGCHLAIRSPSINASKGDTPRLGGDCGHYAHAGQEVCLGQSSFVDGGATRAEDTPRIPPAGSVHFAEPADSGAKPEEALKIYIHDRQSQGEQECLRWRSRGSPVRSMCHLAWRKNSAGSGHKHRLAPRVKR
jgi:hypothetical protein